MRTIASGKPAHIQTISADKLATAIRLLEERLRDCQAQADRETQNDTGRFYYLGRVDAFELALNQCKRPANPSVRDVVVP